MQIPQMIPTAFTVKNVTGGAAILSGFANAVLTAVCDAALDHGSVYPQQYVIFQAPQHTTDTYRGIVDVDSYITQLAHAYQVDARAILDGLKEDIMAMISAGTPPEFAITAINLTFKSLQQVYTKIAETHPQHLSNNTLAYAIKQIDTMIAEEHTCLGLDDIGELLANDDGSTVATWQLVTANVFSELLDDGQGNAVRRVIPQIGTIYASDVYTAVFDIVQWERANERTTKAIMFGNLQEAAITLCGHLTQMLDGITSDAERLVVAVHVQSALNSYISELNGVVKRSEVVQVTEPEADTHHSDLLRMRTDGIFTTALNCGEYNLTWEGLPFNPMTPLQQVILTHIATSVQMHADLRVVSGVIADPFIENVSLNDLSRIICKTWGINIAAIPVDATRPARVFMYLLDVLHSSNYNVLDSVTHTVLCTVVKSQLDSTDDLRIETSSLLYHLFASPLDTRYTHLYWNGSPLTGHRFSMTPKNAYILFVYCLNKGYLHLYWNNSPFPITRLLTDPQADSTQ